MTDDNGKYVAVLCTRDRGECDSGGVLATRAKRPCIEYEHQKFVEQHVDFWAPYKTGRNYAEMRSYGAVLSRARTSECGSRGVLARAPSA